MDQGLKTSNIPKGKAFPKISTRPSYRSTLFFHGGAAITLYDDPTVEQGNL
jgi:hypothetical protein